MATTMHSSESLQAHAVERRTGTGGASALRRRISDSRFNRLRWPLFVYAWAALGVVSFAYVLLQVLD